MKPGKIERRWRSRLYFRFFGFWPEQVVQERLDAYERKLSCAKRENS